MQTDDLTIVKTRGDLVQRAEQFGEAVRANYAAIRDLYGQKLALLEHPQTKEKIAAVKACFLDGKGRYLDHTRGIARGLGVRLEDLVNLNICTMVGKIVSACCCSGLAITRNGQTVVGQNIDTTPAGAAPLALEIGQDPDGPGVARMCSVFPQDFCAGINPAGIGVGSCSGPNGIDTLEEFHGVTGTLRGPSVFCDCHTLDDVTALAKNIPVVGRGFNSVYTDGTGRVVWIQYGGGRSGIECPDAPYGVATAYRTKLPQPDTEKARQDVKRWERMMNLASRAMENNGDLVEDVKTILADHYEPDGHPVSSPCRHGGDIGDTQYSFVFDLTHGRVHYCGQPCRNEWREISLT